MTAIRSRHGSTDPSARASAAVRTLRAVLWAVIAAVTATTGLADPAEAKRRAAYIIVEPESGEILASHRSRVKMHPASLTKMMTLYLAFDALEAGALTPSQTLVASRRVASMPPSEVGLKRGGRISVQDAIEASAVKSANDAAVALAEAMARTESRFADLMTARAKDLGMRRTRFRNASGLTRDGHLSTAEDMAILARRLWTDHRDRYGLFGKRSVTVMGRRYRNTNRLLGAEPGVDGLKTGYTRRAGFNLAATAERGGKRVLVVYLGGASGGARNRRVAQLLDKGFALLKEKRSAPRRWLPDVDSDRNRAAGDLFAAAPRPMRRPASLATVRPVAVRRPAATEDWAVQVGAFGDRDRAARLLAEIRRIGEPTLAQALEKVVQTRRSASGRAVHRARFLGLQEAQARSACQRLQRAGKDCALVPPSGWRAL